MMSVPYTNGPVGRCRKRKTDTRSKFGKCESSKLAVSKPKLEQVDPTWEHGIKKTIDRKGSSESLFLGPSQQSLENNYKDSTTSKFESQQRVIDPLKVSLGRCAK